MAALNDLKAASSKATEVLKDSCPTEVPLTPVSRLDALDKRLSSMTQAVQIVQGPLQAFYDSLTDDQKQKFDAVGESSAKRETSNGPANLCSEKSENFTQLPLERIKRTLQPNQHQQAALYELNTASSKASSKLEESCPNELPQSPAERLDAVAKRLGAMSQAVDLVRPALKTFYASLTDEQKARFNVMGEGEERATGE
jgi:hypothetical protein